MQRRVTALPSSMPLHSEASFAARLASHAVDALVQEALLTPKPGLVDRRGSGAHHDLSLDLMLTSALTLQPYFETMVCAAQRLPIGLPLREDLGALGREAEAAMLLATHGVNTHRGAIWSLGLLIAAVAQCPAANVEECCRVAGLLAAMPDRHALAAASHGETARIRFGATGARGEAVAGFPHVRQYGLPALRSARATGTTEPQARLHALLSIMAHVQDTCLLHRGGPAALQAAQLGARAVIDAGGCTTVAGMSALHALDAALLGLWASPGGSADLLAATIFLDATKGITHD